MNNRTSKKGFTIVELVIVVAVIAILAAVLIPTFAGIIDKARMSSDQVAVRNMNTALATDLDSSKGFYEAKKALTDAGINADKLAPSSIGHVYLWDSENNVVVLVNEETNKVVYPEQYVDDDASDVKVYFDLTLPAAKVVDGEKTVTVSADEGVTKESLDLAASYVFTANNEESVYDTWYADYIISFDKNVNDVTLAGYYASWCDTENGGAWVALPVENIEAGTENGLLQYVLEGQLPYSVVRSSVSEFKCGVVDADGDDAGTTITVELRLTNPENTDEYKVVGIYTYTF